jgi:hypothetical protein
MAKKTVDRTGPASLFHGKLRKPVTLTLTPAHHRRVNEATAKLGLSRSDLIGLLIDKYARNVTMEYTDAYKWLRDAVDALGGSLVHVRRGETRGGTSVLTLGDKLPPLRMPSERAERYPDLDACYQLKDGVVRTGTWKDYSDQIDPVGVAHLFANLVRLESA